MNQPRFVGLFTPDLRRRDTARFNLAKNCPRGQRGCPNGDRGAATSRYANGGSPKSLAGDFGLPATRPSIKDNPADESGGNAKRPGSYKLEGVKFYRKLGTTGGGH